MKIDEIKYLVDNLSSLCGIPTRIYKNNKMIDYSSLIVFPKDPIILDEEILLTHKEHVGYYINESFFNYGLINYGDLEIIIGPFRFQAPSNQELVKLAFDLSLNKEDTKDFINSMNSIISMPLSSVIQSLCMLNFILNKEKLAVSDIIINNENESSNYNDIQSYLNNTKLDNTQTNNTNSAYIIEKEIERIVEHGETNKLMNLIKNAPSVRPGILSNDLLKQYKNIFIVTATIVSRAAIKGGVSSLEALKLSDLYIQKMELLNSISEIQTLQLNMASDYTNLVNKIRGNNGSSELLISLNKYIINHISDAIKINDICDALFISKSCLFEHIKKETGSTVSDYIMNFKINEAKNLIKYTDKNLLTISIYLGFSSQSHFNHTFKKITGYTPLEYKKK